MSFLSTLQDPTNVEQAYSRIKDWLLLTPVIVNESLNDLIGHDIYFKVDSLQKTGTFKVRGVLNHILSMEEKPKKISTYSTGNHGIGLSYVARKLNIYAKVYLPNSTEAIKKEFIEFYGGHVVETESREKAEYLARNDPECYFLHPSDSDTTIAGAGTMCYEALKQIPKKPDAIFCSIGGGGLISGSFLAKELLAKDTLLFGSEPESADDAYLSKKHNKIFRLSSSPKTIADGLRTLSLSPRTFEYIKKINDIFLISEETTLYWTAWLNHLLKVYSEPSCAINMGSVCRWTKHQIQKKTILVLISGGNVDFEMLSSSRKCLEKDLVLYT